MSRPAHRHYCRGCYPKNQGWWRCIAKPCTRKMMSLCKKHDKKLQAEEQTP